MPISYERDEDNYPRNYFATISTQQSYLDYQPSASSFVVDQAEYLDNCSVPEDTFVSPISYDPSTGIYTPTYRAGDTEFLRLYGQPIILPDDGADSMDWNYQSSSIDSVPLRNQDGHRSSGMYFPSNANNACQSSELDSNDMDMLQYLASPVPNHSHPSNFGSAGTASSCADDAYMSHQQAHGSDEEDIIQPSMIVPSQQHLVRYLGPAHPQYTSEAIVSPVTHAPPAAGMRMPQASNQDLRTPTPMADAFPIVPSMHRSLPRLAIHASEQDVSASADSTNTSLQMASGICTTGDLHQCIGDSPPQSPAHSKKRRHSTRARSPSPPAMSSRSSSVMTMPERPAVVKLSQIEKKPLILACLFCRARKIACAPALPGSGETGCNQCARRHLCCEYPTESRRGMRRRPSKVVAAEKAAGRGGAKPRKRSIR